MSSIQDVTSRVTGGVRGNSEQEAKWLASAPKEMRGQMEAQLEMQKVQELMQLLGQMMKQISELSKTTIRNIGG